MGKLTSKPIQPSQTDLLGRYERFNLRENPFPPEPAVNKDSADKRINGGIYEVDIRKKEYEQIEKVFLKQDLVRATHVRLGYIVDTSYIGRGNGKSAFLVNLQERINDDFCMDISKGTNKCFALYVQPEPGGRTKTFSSFVDRVFQAMLESNIISMALGILRLNAILELYPKKSFEMPESDLITKLNDQEWYRDQGMDFAHIAATVLQKDLLQSLPTQFPLMREHNTLISELADANTFRQYYQLELKKPKDRLEFMFDHLVRLFLAASFNGAFILVDDFERIPDWQSARQKKDFALELRNAIFDGVSLNARIGFYNYFLVLHAGVQSLISEAWSESGMENRAPISPTTASGHVVPFEKLDKAHALLMIKKYLDEYRTDSTTSVGISPFSDDVIAQIGEASEYNAAKILKICYDLLELAADSDNVSSIDSTFFSKNKSVIETSGKSQISIENTESLNLADKIKGDKK